MRGIVWKIERKEGEKGRMVGCVEEFEPDKYWDGKVAGPHVTHC